MDTSTGLEIEYLTEDRRTEGRYAPLAQVSDYRPDARNTDLALSCELLRLTHAHLTILEASPMRLELLSLLHFNSHPCPYVHYSDSDLVTRGRLVHDPLYLAYYDWCKQFTSFLNSLALSWGVWEGPRFSSNLRASRSEFSALAGSGSGMTVDVLSLAGAWSYLEKKPRIDPIALTSHFDSLTATLLALNKDADLSQVAAIEDRFYPRSFIITPTRVHTKITPAEQSRPLPKTIVLETAKNIGMRLLKKPPNPLWRCCAGDADDEIKLELIRVVVTYERFALG